MDHLRQIAAPLIGEVPDKVVAKANNLSLQSTTAITLKPNEEPARSYICVYLAIEALSSRLKLPKIANPKPPIPPAQFKSLLKLFKDKLGLAGPRTPRKRRSSESDFEDSEYESPSPTPRKTPRRSPQKSPTKSRNTQSPSKRTQSPRSPYKSPRKTPSRRDKDPTAADIFTIVQKAGLSATTAEAVSTGYNTYNGLVKDKWGLLLGVAYVVGSRAEPGIVDLGNRLCKAAPIQESSERLEEWIHWAQRIVTGQSWVTAVAVEPEPVNTLYSGAGAWGLRLPPKTEPDEL